MLANQIFERWADELNRDTAILKKICSLEIEAYVKRFAYRIMNATSSIEKVEPLPINLVEQMAVFIAANFTSPIKVADVAKAVELHPDYANSIFKKNIWLYDFLLFDRTTSIVCKTKVEYNPGPNNFDCL